jgi:hypothetical protein
MWFSQKGCLPRSILAVITDVHLRSECKDSSDSSASPVNVINKKEEKYGQKAKKHCAD